jgi:hypothetical protein
MLIYALPNSKTASVLVSLSPWQVILLGLDIPSSSPCSSTICAANFPLKNLQLHKFALPIFLWRTYSYTNLRYQFISLLAWLPAPLGTVLDSLLKCAPRAHLTLLHLGFFLVIWTFFYLILFFMLKKLFGPTHIISIFKKKKMSSWNVFSPVTFIFLPVFTFSLDSKNSE